MQVAEGLIKVRRKENVVEGHLQMQVILPLTIIELPCKSPALTSVSTRKVIGQIRK
ncbi:hypothetical protein HPB52_006028 [Rhipicephalus sanguineus]|uniref:Uncharacterized protein n=1 Tax=Rhipicephalus sanguineus TaxID=34632 RepID=A0A9D4SZN0_RHISA|nr:hypothetical protein HPB52_006028 [Rhipicephalus sanguineus]